MRLLNTVEIEVKKSKFIAYYFEVSGEEEAKAIILDLKKEHKKARHIPYAYKIDQIIRKTDDKEPSNTAGTPIYNLIIKKDLNNVLIAVVRYFGGTLLGAGLLTRSYSNAANLSTLLDEQK